MKIDVKIKILRTITILLIANPFIFGFLSCQRSEFENQNLSKADSKNGNTTSIKDISEIEFYKALSDSFPFEKYEIKEIYKGKIAKLDLSFYKNTSEDILDHILDQYDKINQPNFAGQYIIISWGCGSPCQMHAVIDSKIGITIQLINTASGLRYKKDSYLLIENPPEDVIFDKEYRNLIGKPKFELFENNKLIKLNK